MAVAAILSLVPAALGVTAAAAAPADATATTTTVAPGATDGTAPAPAAPTTTAPPTTPAPTTTTTAPPTTPAPTTTTTAPAPTTTTTTVPPYAGVPPPPQVPPVTATPAQLARAAQLEQEIATASVKLDELGAAANRAQAAADAAADSTRTALVRLGEAQAEQSAAHDATIAAEADLQRTALNIYLGAEPAQSSSADAALAAYQNGIARVYTNDVVGTVRGRVRNLRTAERRAADAAKAVEQEAHRAQAAQAAADTARKQVQDAIAAAVATEAQLSATLGQVQGDLVNLVVAAQAGVAWTTYEHLRGGRLLDFKPDQPLPPPLPQTTRAIALATAQVGKPYLWGGTGPDSFDCSGLMQWSWGLAGIRIPRVAADQQAWAAPVPISQILPGDLVFFGSPAHHVGMYLGNGLMVNAPHTGATVEIVPIWWSDLSGFGRVHF